MIVLKKFLKHLLPRRLTNIGKDSMSNIELLRRTGIQVSVINQNDQCKEGFLLGKMNDKYSVYGKIV